MRACHTCVDGGLVQVATEVQRLPACGRSSRMSRDGLTTTTPKQGSASGRNPLSSHKQGLHELASLIGAQVANKNPASGAGQRSLHSQYKAESERGK